MKLLPFVLSLVFSSVALSAQQISGKIEKINFTSFLKVPNSAVCNAYRIEANTEEAAKSIDKLSKGDALTASGVLDNRSCRVLVDSVDYVGLMDLLGYWYNDEGYVEVHDFNSVSVYSKQLKTLNSPIEYKYSVTPSSGADWVVFLSTAESTIFATVNLKKYSATIKIYDSENGNIVKTINLNKMRK
ncbi:MAG: hypothetical protein ACXVCP_04090 [Bdellovibrio sp.]